MGIQVYSYCYLIFRLLTTITPMFCPLAVHEKIFILFMLSSLLYMIVMIKTFNKVHKTMTEHQRLSYTIKKILFTVCITSTFTLIIYFIKHRFYCHDLGNLQLDKIKKLTSVIIILICRFCFSIHLVCTQRVRPGSIKYGFPLYYYTGLPTRTVDSC